MTEKFNPSRVVFLIAIITAGLHPRLFKLSAERAKVYVMHELCIKNRLQPIGKQVIILLRYRVAIRFL